MGILDMSLDYTWWWGFNAGALGTVGYPFIAIIPMSILTFLVQSIGQIELFDHLTVYKHMIDV